MLGNRYRSFLHPNTLRRGIYPGSGVPSGAQIGKGGLNTAGSSPRPGAYAAVGSALQSAARTGGVAIKTPPAVQPATPVGAVGAGHGPRPLVQGPTVAPPAGPGRPGGTGSLPDKQAAYDAKPSGFFMWDAGKWGFLNKNGQVDWNAAAPGKGAHVIPMPGGLSGMPERVGSDARFMGTTYQGMMTDPNARLAQAESGFNQAKSDNQTAYDMLMTQIADGYKQSFYRDNAGLAARGLGSSGVRERTDLQRVKSRDDSLRNADVQYGSTALTKLLKQLQDEKDLYSNKKQHALQYSKDEYFGEHSKALKNLPSGFYSRNGNWFYRNKQGVVVSVKKPGKGAHILKASEV